MARSMIERPRNPAERAEIGRRQIRDAAGASDHHDGIDPRRQQVADMRQQRPPVVERRRLLAAKAARSPAGEDRTQDQETFSSRTGTDFAAGTWLCSALWVTDIRMLHSG